MRVCTGGRVKRGGKRSRRVEGWKGCSGVCLTRYTTKNTQLHAPPGIEGRKGAASNRWAERG